MLANNKTEHEMHIDQTAPKNYCHNLRDNGSGIKHLMSDANRLLTAIFLGLITDSVPDHLYLWPITIASTKKQIG